MAIDGAKFLKVGKAGFFTVRKHAQRRIEQFLGFMPGLEDAFEWFCLGRQVTFSEMWMRGYRPAYRQRKAAGVPTWYFELPCENAELIAVITRGEESGEYEWVTTYTRTHRNESNTLWWIQNQILAA